MLVYTVWIGVWWTWSGKDEGPRGILLSVLVRRPSFILLKPVLILSHHLNFYPYFLPEEDEGILEGWFTEGIFSKGGGGGMFAGGEGSWGLAWTTRGCRLSDGTIPGRPLWPWPLSSITRSPTLGSCLAESSTLTEVPGLTLGLKSGPSEKLDSCLLYFDPASDSSAEEITTASEMSLSVESALISWFN